ncbi:PP2C family protein-serine/threonine phosphatase [Actinomadura scrupuli]|uniref:PP2C family protein-serine/threonine phosphatase n=1 Tax=Actinomadura scrupuli TaxID=559629 RepID=UPI003D97A64C
MNLHTREEENPVPEPGVPETPRSARTPLRTETLRLRAVARTNPGTRRPSGDGYLITEGLVAVADGVGASPPAASASAVALGAVMAARGHPAEDARETLIRCVASANGMVRRASQRDPRLAGMATTLDVVLLDTDGREPLLRFAHVGNGALWHWADGVAPRLLTTPHSAGDTLLRGIGLVADVPPGLDQAQVKPGDRFLLCTDGVTRELGDTGLAALLTEQTGRTAEECAQHVLDAAFMAGTRDDATVVVLEIVQSTVYPPA